MFREWEVTTKLSWLAMYRQTDELIIIINTENVIRGSV